MRYLKTKRLPIGDLVPYPGNARIHDQPALDRSLAPGQHRSVMARILPDGSVQLLAGHGTIEAMARKGVPDAVHPSPLPYRYTVRDALPWIIRQAHCDSGWGKDGGRMAAADRPSPTIGSGPSSGSGHWPPSMVEARVIHEAETPVIVRKTPDGEPLDNNVAQTLVGYAIGEEWDRIGPGGKSAKYQSLVRPVLGDPSPTITARGGGTGVAGVTHPIEKRKFTLAELRRICGFPDDFILTGNYAQGWERLGRAVPPVMMAHVAATVRDQILTQAREPVA